MKKLKKLLALLLAAVLCACCCAFAEEAAPALETDVTEIQKYGNLVLGISASDLLGQGYEYGDIVTVTVAGQALDMPVGSNYSDVDNGSMICRAAYNEGSEQNMVILAINMGDLATALGIAEKATIEEDPGFRWDYVVEAPVPVIIEMKEKGGYADEYMIHQLSGSNERADYPDLTDEQFANFRNVATTGMGAGAFNRSSSPVDPRLNRNHEADEALNGAGVQTVMNLADNEETLKGYEDYANSYYAQRNVIALNLGVDFTADDFKAGLCKGMVFFAENEGPYLVHCTEGKDRAGFVSAVLECLMGASADEVIADYMVTFYNYYGVAEGTEQYEAIVRSNISKSLATAFGVEDIRDADLAAGAEAYLSSIGMTDEQIGALKDNLGKDYYD